MCADVASVQAEDAADCGRYEPPHRWYCVQTEPKSEIAVSFQIDGLGFRRHLPLHVASRKRNQPIKKARGLVIQPEQPFTDIIRPFFPGYLFVQFDPTADEWTEIGRKPGVRRLIRSSFGRPIPVPSGIVEALIAQGRPGDGVIDDAYAGPEMPGIEVGQRVRITSGPFKYLVGLCTLPGEFRIGLLLEAMSGASVTVDRRAVEQV